MFKRTVFTTITPLPANITRDVAVDFLQNHLEMIDLNPLVKERHTIKPPAHSTPEEMGCVWWSLTDKVSYLPGGLVTGDVSYTCAFHDLPNGLQTHCYAPMGLEIRDKWTVNGNLPGEPIQPGELGIGAPLQGLYIREDVDMKCNFMMTSFVKRTLKKAHATLVERLKVKAQIATAVNLNHAISVRHSVQSIGSDSVSYGPASNHPSWGPGTPEQFAIRPASSASGGSVPRPQLSPPPQFSPLLSEFSTASTPQQRHDSFGPPPNPPTQYPSPPPSSITWQRLSPTAGVHGRPLSQNMGHYPPHPDYGYLNPQGQPVDQYGRPYKPYPGYGYAPAPPNSEPHPGPMEMDAGYTPLSPPPDSKARPTAPGNPGTSTKPNQSKKESIVAELE